jgi:hypothetical protein
MASKYGLEMESNMIKFLYPEMINVPGNIINL